MPRRRPLLRVTLFAALFAAACAASEAPLPASPVATSELLPPQGHDFASPAWSAASPGEEVVARVAGVPITRAFLDAHLAANPDLTPAQALDALIVREALAQEAVRRGLGRTPEAADAWRQALVQTWLEDRFEAEHGPERLTADEVRRLYANPSVRKLYDHEHAWRMVHLAIVCCNPTVGDCDRPHVAPCFDDAARKLHEVYAELKPLAAPLEGDADAVAQAMARYRARVEAVMPELFWREVSFFYDPDKPHAEQRGYNIVAEAVARAVVTAPVGVLLAPVQSSFGWHIIVKVDHIPRSRKGPDDPEVDADIRNKSLDGMRQAWFLRRVRDLLAEHQVAMHPEALQRLQPESL